MFCMINMLFIVVSVSLWLPVIESSFGHDDCNNHHHNIPSVSASVSKAQAALNNTLTTVPIADRLAIMILFSDGFVSHSHHGKSNSNRQDFLHCSLLKLQQNLMKTTTADIFIWILNRNQSEAVAMPSWLNGTSFPRVHVMEIEPETWRVPCGLVDDSRWAVRDHFSLDYYLMGRWRLTFSLDFARAMGYRYHLQLDDDALLNEPVHYDLVRKMGERGGRYLMGVLDDPVGEVATVTLGLPELTAYWLKVSGYAVKGPLFQHLRPRSLAGLTSEGWDRIYYPGFFIVMNVEFWFMEATQSYLTAVLRSGRDVEGRWQEQAVMNMVRLVMVPTDRLAVLGDIEVKHERHGKHTLEQFCVRPGLITPGA